MVTLPTYNCQVYSVGQVFFFFFFAVKGLEATNYDLKSKTKELLQDLTLPLHLPRKIMKYMVVSYSIKSSHGSGRGLNFANSFSCVRVDSYFISGMDLLNFEGLQSPETFHPLPLCLLIMMLTEIMIITIWVIKESIIIPENDLKSEV